MQDSVHLQHICVPSHRLVPACSVPASQRTCDEGGKRFINTRKSSSWKASEASVYFLTTVWAAVHGPLGERSTWTWLNLSWNNRCCLDKLCKWQRCFSVNTQGAAIHLSGDLHLQRCNASKKPQHLMCWMLNLAKCACGSQTISPQAWIPEEARDNG